MRKVLVLLAVGMLLDGCASATRGWDESIQINSNPPEASVRLSNRMSCVTPCKLKVGRWKEFTAVISKPGFQTEARDRE